jgi:hypothetical protein
MADIKDILSLPALLARPMLSLQGKCAAKKLDR